MIHRPAFASLLTLILAASACTSPDDRPKSDLVPSGPPGALTAAHKAYLESDHVAVGERIRDVLLDPASSDLVKENAYELLEKTYEVEGGKLPSTFKMPDGFQNLQYGTIHKHGPHGPAYSVFARGRLKGEASRVTGFTVRRLPDEIILDRATRKGRFELQDKDPEEGTEDFNVDSGTLDHLPADGVYTMRIELAGGAVSEGWFIVHGLAATASPDLRSPAASAIFTDPNPAIRWVPFRSPQAAPFERRALSVYVSKGDDTAWDYWTWDPGNLGEVRIGKHPGAPALALTPGDYWVAVGHSEQRWFGPVRLVRAARSSAPFSVR